MRSTMRIAHRVRVASILAAGAVGVHQLRYLFAGTASPAELAGHGYMGSLLAPIAVLVLAGLVGTLIRGTEGASPEASGLGRRVALFALALLSIYVGQEFLEAALAVGHPAGPGAILANGGWIALPLSLAIGALAALLARALEAFEQVVALVHAIRRSSRPPAVRGRALPARGLRLPSSPLAFGLARRPPPPAPVL
jgi:hypothetical protein